MKRSIWSRRSQEKWQTTTLYIICIWSSIINRLILASKYQQFVSSMCTACSRFSYSTKFSSLLLSGKSSGCSLLALSIRLTADFELPSFLYFHTTEKASDWTSKMRMSSPLPVMTNFHACTAHIYDWILFRTEGLRRVGKVKGLKEEKWKWRYDRS